MSRDFLKRQLEMTRYERALSICESMAQHRVLLTTFELARLNNALNGKKPEDEPWRKGQATVTLPSGKAETLALLSDPKLTCREKLHRATELAENGHVIDAAVYLYSEIVLTHPFEDANRRTAVLAAHYFLRRYDIPVSGVALHEIGLGDIRDPMQLESLKQTIQQMANHAMKQ